MKKYKYLLWDIDGTILDFRKSEHAAIKALFPKFGLGEATDEMIARYSVINVKYWEYLELNKMTKPEILVGRFHEFFEKEGLDVSKAAAFNDAYQLALGDTIAFCDNALEMLKATKGEYVLAAVTNGTEAAQVKKLRTSGLDQIFDYIFISERVGFEKPNIGFFDAVFSAMGITSPDECIIIGDSLTGDIRGGLNAGIDTCWYNPERKPNHVNVIPKFEIQNLLELEDII